MKHPLRKVVSLFAVLLLLCSLIPSAVTAAGRNLLVNGDFETGAKSPWKCNSGTSAIVTDAMEGKYALQLTNPSMWGEAAIQTVSVKSNTDYSIVWWSKRASGTGVFNVYVVDGSSFKNLTSVSGQNWMKETSGSWVRNEYVVNTGSSTSLMVKFSSETTNAGSIIVDDVSVTEVVEPSNDGYITNGTFETGSASPWTMYDPSTVSEDAAYEGYCGAHLKGNGGWGTLMSQTLKGFSTGETYEISMWIKVKAQGVNIQIKNMNNDGADLAGGYYDTAKCGTWTKVTFRFTAQSNTVFLNFCGSGSGSAEDLMVDNVACAYIPPVLVHEGGMSVRDGDNDERGLAFKFDVTAKNGKISIRNEYQSNSATVNVGGVDYPLIEMGAVMTNNAAVGAGEMTLANVDGKRVINVPAVYLCHLEKTSLSYAVRILDIPDNHVGTDIYARPYYVYSKNGNAVTVYGDTQSGNYADVLGE